MKKLVVVLFLLSVGISEVLSQGNTEDKGPDHNTVPPEPPEPYKPWWPPVWKP